MDASTSSIQSRKVARKRVGSAKRIAAKDRSGKKRQAGMTYHPSNGVDGFVQEIRQASPMQLIETERNGVSGQLLKDLAHRLDVPLLRLYAMVGVPKATAEKKAASKTLLAGAGGQAALGVARLLAIAEDIVADSTAPEAKDFDAGQWLGRWLNTPQPALGGRRPSEMLDTPTGMSVVTKVLGAVDSDVYV